MLCHNCPLLDADTMQRAYAQLGKEWTPRERCCSDDPPPLSAKDFNSGVAKLNGKKQMIKKDRRRDNGHPKRWRPS